jgi:biotin synthase
MPTNILNKNTKPQAPSTKYQALPTIFNKIDNNDPLSRDDIKFMLSLETVVDIQSLYQKAYSIKEQTVGTKVFFRGIVEFSNICEKDCYYCGIRKSNEHAERFMLTADQIVESALWAHQSEYGSIVLQSGERSDPWYIDLVEEVLQRVKAETNGELGITLSLGEQSEDTYKRWFKAGGHRYLLRIETTNPELYGKLHPPDHSFEERCECLKLLRKLGYQVGTGVMIGLPYQTIDDLAGDILFFKDNDIDMIGMGPYIVHHETPLADVMPDFDNDRQLDLGLKMVAVARIVLRDVNIAATTALQALNPTGREMGLKAGANIIMPNITETKYRASYQLYNGKPCLDENSTMCRGCLQRRIDSIGEKIGFNEWGDSPHFIKKTK